MVDRAESWEMSPMLWGDRNGRNSWTRLTLMMGVHAETQTTHGYAPLHAQRHTRVRVATRTTHAPNTCTKPTTTTPGTREYALYIHIMLHEYTMQTTYPHTHNATQTSASHTDVHLTRATHVPRRRPPRSSSRFNRYKYEPVASPGNNCILQRKWSWRLWATTEKPKRFFGAIPSPLPLVHASRHALDSRARNGSRCSTRPQDNAAGRRRNPHPPAWTQRAESKRHAVRIASAGLLCDPAISLRSGDRLYVCVVKMRAALEREGMARRDGSRDARLTTARGRVRRCNQCVRPTRGKTLEWAGAEWSTGRTGSQTGTSPTGNYPHVTLER